MAHLPSRLAIPLVLLSLAALPAWAASSASSAVSDSASTSVGSISDSFEHSSNSSSRGDRRAEGDYRVIDVAAAPDRPGTLRMKLHAVAQTSDEDDFNLYLPQAAVELGHVAAGHIVTAQQRPYGLEFAHAQTPFYLVLSDDWYRELQTRLVTL